MEGSELMMYSNAEFRTQTREDMFFEDTKRTNKIWKKPFKASTRRPSAVATRCGCYLAELCQLECDRISLQVNVTENSVSPWSKDKSSELWSEYVWALLLANKDNYEWRCASADGSNSVCSWPTESRERGLWGELWVSWRPFCHLHWGLHV